MKNPEHTCSLDEVDNGFDALLMCLTNNYALVLLDINMPDLNGFEVCEQLRTNPQTAEIPIIFVTATYKDIADNIHGYATGATDYLTKPINDTILRAKTKIFLKLYQQQQALIDANYAIELLVSGIAHEINTPLGAIRSSADNINNFLTQTLLYLPILIRSFSEDEYGYFINLLDRALKSGPLVTSAKQQRLNRQALVQLLEGKVDNAEDIASFLVDMGVYDDIEAIMPLLNKKEGVTILEIAYQLSEIRKGVQTISNATERTSKIVFALKLYNQQNASEEKTCLHLPDSIDSALKFYQAEFDAGVELVKSYAESLPKLNCYANDLTQVWMHLIHNALDAMDYKGCLTISVSQSGHNLCVIIQDTGTGISCENMPKIFYPFFTTKMIGDGSGLGLHIIKQIVEKHQGTITVTSIPGCTQFTVLLPLVC